MSGFIDKVAFKEGSLVKKGDLLFQIDPRPFIKLGPKLEGLRIVRDGLKEGETIAVNGLQRVRPGNAAQPQNVPMADADTLAALKEQNRAISAAMKPQAVDRTLAREPSS